MRKHLMVLASAFLLSGCLFSNKRQAVSSTPPPPPPPSALLQACSPTPWVKNADGSMSKAQVEQNLGLSRVDLADCDARRKAGADSWPKE